MQRKKLFFSTLISVLLFLPLIAGAQDAVNFTSYNGKQCQMTVSGGELDWIEAVDPDTIEGETYRPLDLEQYGLWKAEFTPDTVGGTIVVEITLPEEILIDMRWIKWSDEKGWLGVTTVATAGVSLLPYAEIGDDFKSVTLELVDGGLGDDVPYGEEDINPDGVIKMAASGFGSMPEELGNPGRVYDGGCFIDTAANGSQMKKYVTGSLLFIIIMGFMAVITLRKRSKCHMRNILMVFLATVFGVGLVFGDISWVNAQDEFTLEEITVTAQKREESHQDVPIAMQILTGDTIKEYGYANVEDILQGVSTVLLNRGTDGYRVSIRGMDATEGSMAWDTQIVTPMVAINVDNVYQKKVSVDDLYDVERVEVLFGPQGTLYSSTSPGGIVNVVTKSPELNVYEGNGTLQYGNFNHFRTSGIINVPIIEDTFAIRGAFSASIRNGYNSNGSSDEDSRSGRLRTLYKPNDQFSVLFTVEYAKYRDRGIGPVQAFEYQHETTNPWTSLDAEVPERRDQSLTKLYMEFNYSAPWFDVMVIPGKTEFDREKWYWDNDSGRGFKDTAEPQRNTTNEENVDLRITSRDDGDSRFTWILGGTIYDSTEAMELYGFRFYTDPDETYPYYDGQWTIQSNKALYASLTYSITDTFRGTLGYRYSKDKNGYTGIHTPAIYSVRPWDPDNMPTSKSMFHGGYKGGDKKVGIEYDWNDDVLLYADWSTSYRAQAHGGYNQVGDPWPPEFVDSYTLGMKSRFFENRLELNTSAYYYDYTNYLGSMNTRTIIDENENGIRDPWEVSATRDPNGSMAGSIGVYGLDVITSTLITPKDKFDLSISYLKGEFEDMLFDYWDITNSLGLPDFNAKGMPKTNSPEWTVSAGYNHIFHLANGGTLTLHGDTKYTTDYLLQWQTLSFNWASDFSSYTIDDLTELITQEKYTCSNASLVYANPDGKYTFTAYLNNIENYAAKLSYGGMRGNLVITDPRTWGFILSVNF